MTPKGSSIRLILYVSIAMVAAAQSGISSVNFSDRVQVIQFILGVIVTGLVTARSYIDQSPTQVNKEP